MNETLVLFCFSSASFKSGVLSSHVSLQNVSPSDGEWGVLKVRNDTGESYWTGLVGDLAEGRADVCASSLTITEERHVRE